ncbi:MAG TPA: PrsW family glutamic-type intramembrane protease [Candidatus Dormibacteraeota bacterium]|nr:PrsW family glutamic-type intramembrane protease [Candidatus Dormibacteraeota bacterium]
MIDAAYQRPHRPPRYRLAAAIGGGILLALLLGSAYELVAFQSLVAVLDLAGLLLVGLFALGTWLVIRAVDHDPARRGSHLLRAAVLIGVALALFLFAVNLLNARLNLAGVLACIPTTGLALWVIRQVDYNEREPWRLVLVAAGWGAVVATTLALVFESLWSYIVDAGLIPGPGQAVATAFNAALFEEVPKGLAVLLLFLVMRDEFDDVVDGIVYGAAVGLGFNFMETVVYMSVGGWPQFFIRQVLGLFLGHATYTALIGAGIGIARQVQGNQRKVLVVACGFIVAIAAHFTWDAWLWYFPHPSDPALLVLSIPLQYLAMTGPFFLAVMALFMLGLRAEGRALEAQFAAEALLPDGGVLPREVAMLASPWRRIDARFQALGRHGFGGYRWMRRLQRAQLDLAMERWHRTRREIDTPLEAELRLRDRVLAIRAGVKPPT